ncbi:MAG: pyridoxal-phosphate dependent enzyme, partial [Candidatus Eisenbacteria bacterium]|nr:pyridoxal-phosphate dependent enzyme [Candidatus Eisenbacteria bacterium]
MATSCLTHLECARCSERVDPGVLQTFCSCGGTWLARYNLEAAARSLNPETFLNRRVGFWSYPEVSPSQSDGASRGLGEGGTPLLPIRALPELELNLFAKDEGINPGGSFKARGMASAVSRAKELGASALALPSAGNAGVAAAQYGAFWNLPVHVALPVETPAPFRDAIQTHGATVYE